MFFGRIFHLIAEIFCFVFSSAYPGLSMANPFPKWILLKVLQKNTEDRLPSLTVSDTFLAVSFKYSPAVNEKLFFETEKDPLA